jgi:hypothetical protein
MNKVYTLYAYLFSRHLHPNNPPDQDHLISTLSAHDTSSTRIYTALLSALPVVPAILHLPLLTSISTLLPSLVAITSFLASAYTLFYLPLPPVKIGIIHTADLKSKKQGGYGWNVAGQSDTTQQERTPVPYLSDEVTDLVAKYVVSANGAICVLLALLELWQGRTWSDGMMVGGGYLPGFVLSVVLWARRELRTVDMGELEKLKYRSKAI